MRFCSYSEASATARVEFGFNRTALRAEANALGENGTTEPAVAANQARRVDSERRHKAARRRRSMTSHFAQAPVGSG
jgi:hypothetical protein